ncbi:hypothetical protein NP233_g11482 [Leucocoprinus birnbaumii]|uniref:Nephrocystin 3-like N-terminal domain-containing protein n=1 Tax=Leucocoprinus birnbaumii TaxID=56174 RepID=A0AAD5VGQ8_9AGAR|nr:hypothetical protein NP233_g11482 [Leucocoprinus birnbaumii]
MPSTRLKFTTRFFGGRSSRNDASDSSSTPVLTPPAAQTRALVSPQTFTNVSTTNESSTANDEGSDLSGIIGQFEIEAIEEHEPEVSKQGDRTHRQTAAVNLFQGAHGNMFNNPIFQDVHTGATINNTVNNTVDKQFNQPTFVAELTQNVTTGEPILNFLDRHRVPGTDLRSASRYPPPQCHPDTRLELRSKLEAWLRDPKQRRSFLIWLAGPAGAGKSAVAQTFAEYCLKHGRLGAAYFFSTLNQRGKIEGLIPGIAYHLAKQNKEYKRLINKILADDPSLLKEDLEFQFRKLISEPFDALTPTGEPLVIIIDGLDECDSKQAQCELVCIIGQYSTSLRAKRFPTLWLICSRPERHIQLAFSQADGYCIDDMTGRTSIKESFAEFEWRINYTRENITCDSEADKHDVFLILESGLQDIRKRHMARYPEHTEKMRAWPLRSQLDELSHCICGLPILASTVIKFIGSTKKHPQTKLDLCLMTLRDLPERIKELKASYNVNPLDGLDLFYSAIMRNVEQSVLPIAKHLIAFLVILAQETRWPEKISTASDTRIFFGLDVIDFAEAFEDLHSVLNIPSSDAADMQPIQFFHKSFGEYLQSRERAREFALDMVDTRLEVARHAIRIYGDVISSNCKNEACIHNQKTVNVASDLEWYQEDELIPNAQLRRFVRANFWDMLCLDDSKRDDLLKLLHDFDFCHLSFAPSLGTIDEARTLPRFMSWMSKAIESPGVNKILRVKPASEHDDMLFEHCLSKPPLRKRFPKRIGEKAEFSYSFVSTHRQDKSERVVPDNTKMAFWIGAGERAGLGLIYGSAKDDEGDE